MNEKELRELDAWVAEHVMGWRIHTSGRGSVVATAGGNTSEERDCLIESKHPWDESNWNPTTDPAAAMMVLEKCALEVERLGNELGFDIDLSVGRLNGEFALSHCVTKETVTAETLPLAICLFAKQLFHAQEKETKVH